MTATDELRRLLDERGVEWWPEKYYKDECTIWRANGMEWRASKKTDGKLLIGCTSLAHLTPEQAIAATLGTGTCHNADIGTEGYFKCSECSASCSVDWECSGWDVPRFCPNCGRKIEVESK